MVAHANNNALDRILGPLAKSLGSQSALEIINLRLDGATQATVNALADKAAAGTLTEAERVEYMEFVEAIDMLSIFQAKAREAFQEQTAQ